MKKTDEFNLDLVSLCGRVISISIRVLVCWKLEHDYYSQSPHNHSHSNVMKFVLIDTYIWYKIITFSGRFRLMQIFSFTIHNFGHVQY